MRFSRVFIYELILLHNFESFLSQSWTCLIRRTWWLEQGRSTPTPVEYLTVNRYCTANEQFTCVTLHASCLVRLAMLVYIQSLHCTFVYKHCEFWFDRRRVCKLIMVNSIFARCIFSEKNWYWTCIYHCKHEDRQDFIFASEVVIMFINCKHKCAVIR